MTITQTTKTTADLDALFTDMARRALALDHDQWSQERTWIAREATEQAESYPEQNVRWEDTLSVEEAEYYGII